MTTPDGPESAAAADTPAERRVPGDEPAGGVSPDPALTSRELDRVLVSGIAWTAMAKWATLTLTWLSTLAVARILAPDDYGIAGIAFVFLGLIQMINDLGLGAAIVQNRALTDLHLARLYGLTLLFSAGLVLVSWGAAWPLAAFFGNDAVRPVFIVVSTMLFFSGVQVVPRSLLMRDLRFPFLARLDAAQAVTGAAGTLTLALAGAGYWALVFGNLTGHVMATGVLVLKRPQRAAWPRELAELVGPLRFGGHVILSNLGWYTYTSADSAVAARFLGTAALGAYTVVSSLASVPIVHVTGMLNRVTAGVFSAVQSDHVRLRRYINGLLELSAFIVFPVSAGLALVSADFVAVVIGVQWHSGIIPLQILAAAAALRCLAPILAQALLYSGHPERNTQTTMAGAIVMPLCFIIGSSWGLPGIAAAWLAGTAAFVLPLTLHFARRHLGLRLREFGMAIWPAAVCTLAMVDGVAALEVFVLGTRISAWGLAAQIATGIVIYAATFRLLYWPRLAEFRTLIARARGRA